MATIVLIVFPSDMILNCIKSFAISAPHCYRREVSIYLFASVARIFRCFSGITPPLCVGHKFRWLVYYYVPPDASIRHTEIVGVGVRFGLIFKYYVKTRELMATGNSQRAMKFSAGGVTWWPGARFWGQHFPSEMPGKNCKSPYLGNGASYSQMSKNQTDHCICASRRDSSYEVWSKPEVVYFSDWTFNLE